MKTLVFDYSNSHTKEFEAFERVWRSVPVGSDYEGNFKRVWNCLVKIDKLDGVPTKATFTFAQEVDYTFFMLKNL
jgi:hypothetical protein